MSGRATLTVADGLAELRLVRSDARNAIDPAMVLELLERVGELRNAEDVRAVLISAAGPTFTVGGDLTYLAEHADELSETLDEMIGAYHSSLGALGALEVPVVAAVQGAAAGGGMGFALVADIVVAAENARFASGFAAIGLSGDGGWSWLLPRLIGLRRTQELLLTGRVLTAEEALAWGLVSRVVPTQRLEREARELARRLADGPTDALVRMRRLLRGTWDASLERQLQRERAEMVASAASDDAREGITAFAERRTPSFGGERVAL
jgi:2-(1,2-epoxy-1,2-dihydrophenyl)acetyl-CoA isomerase